MKRYIFLVSVNVYIMYATDVQGFHFYPPGSQTHKLRAYCCMLLQYYWQTHNTVIDSNILDLGVQCQRGIQCSVQKDSQRSFHGISCKMSTHSIRISLTNWTLSRLFKVKHIWVVLLSDMQKVWEPLASKAIHLSLHVIALIVPFYLFGRVFSLWGCVYYSSL